MAKINTIWPQFAMCNDNPTKSFEVMCRRLFKAVYMHGKGDLHVNPNIPGIEVLPVLEPVNENGSKRKRISFQSKYLDQEKDIYSGFKKSAKQTAEHFRGKLDRVYLFCNKTLSTENKAYKEIENILKQVDIETVPVSNEELLDLVNEHPDIAETFFCPRIVGESVSLPEAFLKRMSVNAVTGDIVISPAAFQQPATSQLLKNLVSEKLKCCRDHVFALEMEALKQELDTLLPYGIDGVEGAGEIYYYHLLSLLHDGKDTAEVLPKCVVEYRKEASWLIDYYATPVEVTTEEFKQHTPVTQIFIIDRLFTDRRWTQIIKLYSDTNKTADPVIIPQFEFYYGLSLLNLQENKKASEILHALSERTGKTWMRFYVVLADIRVENNIYQNGEEGRHDVLASLIRELDAFREQKQYKRQEALVGEIKTESLYRLGIRDKEYIEQAITEFDKYSEETKQYPVIQFYYALCLELSNRRDKAIDVYEKLGCEKEPMFAERYMECLLLEGQPEKAITVYEGLEVKNAKIDGIYLLALECSGAASYENEFKRFVEIYRYNLSDFFEFAFCANKVETSKEIIVPVLEALITEDNLKRLLFCQKVGLIAYLARLHELKLLEIVLGTIDKNVSISHFAVNEIYTALFYVADKEARKREKTLGRVSVLEIADRIADRFLAENVERKLFLQIKVMCAVAQRLPISSLQNAEELFKLTRDVKTACIIVTTLYNRGEKLPAKYEPYLDVLKNSDQPDQCMLAAYAFSAMGRENMAEFYAYKALYLLNDSDNYYVYKNYFSLFNSKLNNTQEDELKIARGNVVVTLEESGSDGESERLELCLDSEADFSDDTNRSMGVEHLSASNIDYIRLQGCALKQVIQFRGKCYQITQIVPRCEYGLKFILQIMREKPDMFQGYVWLISADNTDEMLDQFKQLSDRSEEMNYLLSCYHFDNNTIGLPFDKLTGGDYSRYVHIFKYLLYQKDEAFYAGLPINENEEGQKYVPGLSTLVLLSILNRMDMLQAFKKDIIIPESYVGFFFNEYIRAARTDQTSSSSLTFIEGKPVILENDKTDSEIWEKILVFCKTCKSLHISDKERIDFKFSDEVTCEKFIVDAEITAIHLDALLLSRREMATFLCDDLFFRKLASSLNLRNLNIVSLVQHYTSLDYVMPFILELSKTNYIYIPLLSRNDEDAREICTNIMNGEKKQRYYGELLRRYAMLLDYFSQSCNVED